MITVLCLFGREIFRLERVPAVPDEYVEVGTETEVSETEEMYGFAPPSQYL